MNEEFGILPEALAQSDAETAIVLGSGLGAFAESLEPLATITYASVKNLPVSRTPGHEGRLIITRLNSHPIVVAQGRVHLYEGWNAREAAAGVRLLHTAGIKRVIFTNAAGSVNDYFGPGTWMMLNDHINLTGQSPLQGGSHFVDMSEAYSPRLREIFQAGAKELGMTLHEGVYAAVSGPQYETPAEIRMLRRIGADAVGMSTVSEVIQARALGLEVAAFSCLTNWGAGLGAEGLSHDDVLATSEKAAEPLLRLFHAVLPQIV